MGPSPLLVFTSKGEHRTRRNGSHSSTLNDGSCHGAGQTIDLASLLTDEREAEEAEEDVLLLHKETSPATTTMTTTTTTCSP